MFTYLVLILLILFLTLRQKKKKTLVLIWFSLWYGLLNAWCGPHDGKADTGLGTQSEQEGDLLLSARLMVCTGTVVKLFLEYANYVHIFILDFKTFFASTAYTLFLFLHYFLFSSGSSVLYRSLCCLSPLCLELSLITRLEGLFGCHVRRVTRE